MRQGKCGTRRQAAAYVRPKELPWHERVHGQCYTATANISKTPQTVPTNLVFVRECAVLRARRIIRMIHPLQHVIRPIKPCHATIAMSRI
jgi:hypothetical protein